MKRYRIISWSDLYSGDWLVIRTVDNRIMTSGGLWDCARWIKSWGNESAKRGSNLSPKAIERMK